MVDENSPSKQKLNKQDSDEPLMLKKKPPQVANVMGFRPAFGSKGGKTTLVEEEYGESGSSSSSSSGSSDTDDDKEINPDDVKFDMDAYGLKGEKSSGGASSEISQGYLKVPDNNDTGKMINLIFKMNKPKNGKQRPLFRGS
jgi:hypothetical protein